MITACELCTKINMENIIREENIRFEKEKIAEKFAEEIISPILLELKEIPEHLFLGYRYSNCSHSTGLYRSISDWEESITNWGNLKKHRWLTGEIGRGYSNLDYEILEQYLNRFGYQIFIRKEWITFTTFTSSTPERGHYIDHIYLSMICSIE